MSVATARASPPAARIESATASMRSRRRAPRTTRAPAAPRARATAAPIPEEGPVTTPTRPASTDVPTLSRQYGLESRQEALGQRPGRALAGRDPAPLSGRTHQRRPL